MLVFFFSSRRRHTRSLCDWSSDVCSSDLTSFKSPDPGLRASADRQGNQRRMAPLGDEEQERNAATADQILRSEERRVGKECRSRRSTDQSKKKTQTQIE